MGAFVWPDLSELSESFLPERKDKKVRRVNSDERAICPMA